MSEVQTFIANLS